MRSIDIVDRSSLMKGLYQQLFLRAEETAVVTIDMPEGVVPGVQRLWRRFTVWK